MVVEEEEDGFCIWELRILGRNTKSLMFLESCLKQPGVPVLWILTPASHQARTFT